MSKKHISTISATAEYYSFRKDIYKYRNRMAQRVRMQIRSGLQCPHECAQMLAADAILTDLGVNKPKWRDLGTSLCEVYDVPTIIDYLDL